MWGAGGGIAHTLERVDAPYYSYKVCKLRSSR